MDVHDSSVWEMLFDQMPPAIRWIISILTLGMFSLASILWRRHQERIASIEQTVKGQAKKDDITDLRKHVDRRFESIQSQITSLTGHLIEFTDNRGRGR